MSAVWKAARGGITHRRLPTVAVAVVVAAATAATVLAVALLAQATRPYRQLFDGQRGAHVAATFDSTLVPAPRLTAAPPGVTAQAGPFPQADVDMLVNRLPLSGTRVVGRPAPDGPVDDLYLAPGSRWPSRPTEIVLNRDALDVDVRPGDRVVADRLPGKPVLTVVGLASSVTDTADAWVTPGEAVALQRLGAPASNQMLYRFATADTAEQIRAEMATVTAGLPPGALLASQSYLPIVQAAERGSPALPFLMAFAVLGLIVAVVIVINVVNGAVVAGFRTIGVLKALGFTPTQVVGAYAMLVAIPATAAVPPGAVAGLALARPLLSRAAQAQGLPIPLGAAGRALVFGATGPLLLAVLTAFAAAARAGRLPAVTAITTGRAPRTGRGYTVMRLLARTRLPRPVGIGLATPFARPARSAITLVAILLGATTVIFTVGLTRSLERAAYAIARPQIQIRAGLDPHAAGTTPMTDANASAIIGAEPGTWHMAAEATEPTNVVVAGRPVNLNAVRGGGDWLGYTIVVGRWPVAPGEALVAKPFLDATGAGVGDRVSVTVHGGRIGLTVVGELFGGEDSPIYTPWSTLNGVEPGLTATDYEIQLRPGTDPQTYAQALTTHPGLYARVTQQAYRNQIVLVWTPLAILLTLLLAAVAALGVVNTVLLNVRERAHDIGVLKTLGMTPGQVVTMVGASTVAVGLLAGALAVPIAVALHHLVLPNVAATADTVLPPSLLHVYPTPALAALAMSGLAIALLGAAIPAGTAARLKPTDNLRSE